MGCQKEQLGPGRGLALEKERNERTHVPDSDGKKEEKDPEVQVKPLARGSTLVGNPEREEPEQSCRVEGNCQISLSVG